MQLVVGRIGRPHGVRGELTVEVRTDDPELRLAAGSVLVTEPAAAGPLTVTRMRWHSGRLLLTFAGIDDRDRAGELRGTFLVVDSAELEEITDPDEFRDYQLIGLTVIGPDDDVIGEVSDVLHHGQNLLLVEGQGKRAGAEIMIPFVAAIVPDVDIANGRLHVDPPPGLLDTDQAI